MVDSHYHICTGAVNGVPVSNLMFEDYSESLQCFVSLANGMFRSLRGSDYDLSLNQALEATSHGKSRGAYVGTPTLTVYWVRCEEDEHEIAAWN